jgi:hypothetical protein
MIIVDPLHAIAFFTTFGSIPAFADVPIVLAVLLLLSFLLLIEFLLLGAASNCCCPCC